MTDPMTVRIAQRGLLTLPKTLRETYDLNPGDELTLIDLDGVFLLSPRRSELDGMAAKIRISLEDQGETLESMLHALREARAV